MSELRPLLAGVALVLAPLLAYVTSSLPEYQHHGRPSDWAAAFMFFAAALAGCRTYFATGRRIGWHRWLFTAVCGVALVIVIDSDMERTITLGPLAANYRLLLVGTLGSLAWAIWSLEPQARSRQFHAVGGIVLALLTGASLLPLDLFAVYLLSQMVGLIVYLVCTAPSEPTSREA